MNVQRIIDEIGDKQGWSDSSKLKLCLEYIDKQEDDHTFREFLLEVQVIENEAPF